MFTQFVAADEAPRVVEGNSDREKVVLQSFPGAESYWRFESPQYQDISKDRRAGADTVALLVTGLT